MAPKKSETETGKDNGATEGAEKAKGPAPDAEKDTPKTDGGDAAGGVASDQGTGDTVPLHQFSDDELEHIKAKAYAEGQKTGKQTAEQAAKEALDGKVVLTEEELAEKEKAAHRKGYEEALDDERTDEPQESLTGSVDGEAEASPGLDWGRVSLIGVVLSLPEYLRRGGMARAVDDLGSYLETVPAHLAVPAAEFIREIARVRPDDIVNGRYKLDVQSGLNVLMGSPEAQPVGVSAESQAAAAARLSSIVNSNAEPAGFRKGEGGDANLPAKAKPEAKTFGSPEQEASKGRLYSNT